MPSAAELATVATREASFLNQFGDGLPALTTAQGGRWDLVQAYWPGNRQATQKASVYVLVKSIGAQHPMAQRYRPQYLCNLKLVWPIRAASINMAETEQQNFDNAIADLVTRVLGPTGDKSHGGNFLSVAEVPEEMPLAVDYDDPEITIPASKELRALVSYHIDDLEFTG